MSSKKSTNYGLHVWEAQDKFLREEINENTKKTDAELKANAERIEAVYDEMRWVKLVDTTLAADTERWPIDVSGIDFFRYAELRLFIEASVNAYVIVQVNGIKSSTYTYCYTNSNPNKIDRLIEPNYMRSYLLRIALVHPQRERRIVATVEDIGSSGNFHVRACTAPVNWEDFRTLDLTILYDGTVVPAGTRVVLMGLRK